MTGRANEDQYWCGIDADIIGPFSTWEEAEEAGNGTYGFAFYTVQSETRPLRMQGVAESPRTETPERIWVEPEAYWRCSPYVQTNGPFLNGLEYVRAYSDPWCHDVGAAPRGENLLLFSGGEIRIGFWFKGRWEDGEYTLSPTAWRRLPPPPAPHDGAAQ